MGQMLFSSLVPDIELDLYPLQDKLISRDKSLDLSVFKLSRLFFSLLSLGSSSCWRSYGAQTFSGRARLHFQSMNSYIPGSSSMCFLFFLDDLDEACLGAGAGVGSANLI
ncbi:hypothetical protein Tco_0421622 [Tanacetum coccineum]